MVAVQARMSPVGSDTALVDAINAVEHGLRATYPQVRWLIFEPDRLK